MIYDTIIIGAGPAGSTAAIKLAQDGRRVLLLEKSRFPREKLCGEFIAPECLNVFDRLGVRERMLEAGARVIRRFTLFAPDGRGLNVPMEWIANGHPHAIGLSRAAMDWVLLEQARQTGVDVREGFHVSSRLHSKEGLTFIEGKSGAATIANAASSASSASSANSATSATSECFAAPLVIDASGRNGVFSNQVRQRASRFEGSRLFGCKVHLRGVEGLSERGELFFFRDGYGGLSEIENDRVNLCFLTTEATLREAKGDRERLLDLTLRSNRAALWRLQHAEIDGEWLGAGPLLYGRHETMPGVLAIGDAAAFIDPFTGSGMLLALASGELAAKVASESFAAGERKAETIKKRYDALYCAQFGWRFRACAILRRLAFNPMTRNALVTLFSRHQGLMKLAALSTRQRGLNVNSI